MGVLGNLNAYTQLKAAEAHRAPPPRTPAWAASASAWAWASAWATMIGNQMAGMAQQGGGQFNPHAGMQGGPAPAPPPLPTEQKYHYAGAAGQQQLTLQEVVGAVVGNRDGKHMLWMPGWSGWKSWKDVPEVAGQVPPPAAAPPPPPGAAAEEEFHYHGPAARARR